MKLLEACELQCTDKGFVLRICECVKDRFNELGTRQIGYVSPSKEEEYDEWCEITDLAEDIIEKYNQNEVDDELEDIVKELKEKVLDFHMYYKGISRLRI